MAPSTPPSADRNQQIAATVRAERSRLGAFIRRRVPDAGDAEDILQDVFQEFVQAWALPQPIEQAGAWLFRVARNRIIDRFRKQRELPLGALRSDADDDDAWLDLNLPSPDGDPEEAYARGVLLQALQDALDELPAEQRAVFLAHEIEGRSFNEMAQDSGIAVNTLLSRKRYAVQFLRRRLADFYDDMDF